MGKLDIIAVAIIFIVIFIFVWGAFPEVFPGLSANIGSFAPLLK